MAEQWLDTPLARHIWETKYRFTAPGGEAEADIEATWRRVARSLAAVEPHDRDAWEARFYSILEGFRFLPGGRILAGAGTARRVTLFNCFVMGVIEDSLDGIFDHLKEGALTMQAGGGVGYDFSSLRPQGSVAHASGRIASGPVSFMRIWDAMCATIMSTGARRGAMLGSLRCDHPDIEAFVDAKHERGALTHFNLSVQVTDAFMQAVERDADWPLVFPDAGLEADGERVLRRWVGHQGEVPCVVMNRVRARDLWDRIMRSAYDTAEPGVLFIDRINALNNLAWREYITTTNPCGEIPLPPYGACDLGSVNLPRFVLDPFTPQARIDLSAVRDTVAIAVRLLDNVVDASRFPLPQQADQARGARRIGLGVTGLADALIMLGLHYGEAPARRQAADIMRVICEAAYRTSIGLAAEKGSFPFFEPGAYLRSAFLAGLPADIRDGIATSGIRNSHLTAIAPSGTISLLAGNLSSGIEPVFDFRYRRRVLNSEGAYESFEVEDYAWRLWRRLKGEVPTPACFVDARSLSPQAHLDMQAALQPWVDNAISKTINVPADYPYEEFSGLYGKAYRAGVKGCTTYRPVPMRGAVLVAGGGAGISTDETGPHCCSIEREAD